MFTISLPRTTNKMPTVLPSPHKKQDHPLPFLNAPWERQYHPGLKTTHFTDEERGAGGFVGNDLPKVISDSKRQREALTFSFLLTVCDRCHLAFVYETLPKNWNFRLNKSPLSGHPPTHFPMIPHSHRGLRNQSLTMMRRMK